MPNKPLSADLRALLSRYRAPSRTELIARAPVQHRAALRKAFDGLPQSADQQGYILAADNFADTVELLIYGDIGASWWDDESVTAKSVVEALKGITAQAINVRINSYGGAVSDGVAIHNELRRHAANGVAIAVTVDGAACSIASLIAMAGDTVTMPSNTVMMLHAPWGTLWVDGNAQQIRELADEFAGVLEIFGKAMAQSYARKTGKPASEFEAMWATGKDYWYDAEAAKAFGLCDIVTDASDTDVADTKEDPEEAAAALANLIARAPESLRASIRAALAAANTHPQASARESLPASAGATTGATTMPDNTPKADANTTAAVQAAVKALRDRNAEIQQFAAACPDNAEVQAYAAKVIAEADLDITAGDVGKEILRLQAKGRQPLGGGVRTEAGADERDTARDAATQILLARAGVLNVEDDAKARNGNPYNGLTLMDLARDCAARAGVNVRGMDTERVFQAAITQTTSDFPVIFENALHKMLITQFLAGEQHWRAFCKLGTLSDFRPHIRIFGSTFADLDTVNPAGEYKDGTFADGEKQTITGRSKGRILNLSYEAIKNDDIGFFADAAQSLGAAAIRTLNKDVFALFALNSGNGPTMSDGNPLFHASHGNIAAAAATPTVSSVDAARQLMAKQTAPGGGDFLDARPDVWLGPLSLGGAARVVNSDAYDPDAANKLQRTNIAKGTYSVVVDSPRLPDTAWYSIANPNLLPVFEVGFVDGVQVPRLVMQEAFRSNGVQWRVTYDYGVGAVGFRGAVRTPTA